MPSTETIAIIFFFYGLAFYSMGLAILLEIGQCSDDRIRTALRPLAVFGFLHGAHEWQEMFEILELLPGMDTHVYVWTGLRVALLAFSFLSLAAFGAYLSVPDERAQRTSLLVPLGLAAVWGFGVLILRNQVPFGQLWDVSDVWTRYVLAIPSALLASIGLVIQQREFRRQGMAQFGRDTLWAAVAFFWYGLIGQVFTRASSLPPSNVINQGLFMELFGFPVQLLRAGAAIFASIFVIRFLRAFELETKRQIAELQAAQVKEAQRREAQRGEVLRRVVDAQEAERKRVARELHDETGQALTAIGLGLRGVATVLRQDADKAAHNLRQLEGLVARSLDELQHLIADLRPSHLDDLGLAATLRWYLAELQERTNLHIDLDFDGERIPLQMEVKTALFRIIQEALTNVIKHAGAKNVQVRVFYDQSAVLAQVQDDGCGFDPNNFGSENRSPYGLLGMNERASLLGGKFSVDSRFNRGTLVEVSIPYPEPVEVESNE
jgi:signal transduction histidine kinase